MTAQEFHDAMNLLPDDLIQATDRVRSRATVKVIPWRRWAALAAVLILVAGSSFVFQRKILPGLGGASEAMPQAPEMMKDEAPAEAPAAAAPDEAGAEDSTSITNENSAAAAGSSHRHSFAEPEETAQEPAKGYCGNTLTNVYLEDINYTLAGDISIAITDILINLDYDPALVCRCMAEFTVDTETLPGIEVNLTESFARCERGQAALTEAQVQTIREIISNLE